MSSIDHLILSIEKGWEVIAAKVIARTMQEHAEQQFYAAGFWLFYCDYTVIHPPCLGMNSESQLAKSPEDAPYHRWTPPNWQFDVLDGGTDQMMASYQPLHGGHDEATWEQIVEKHKQAIARVCRQVTARARSGSGLFAGVNVPADFVVGIFEEQDGEEEYDRLAVLSIGRDVIFNLDGLLR